MIPEKKHFHLSLKKNDFSQTSFVWGMIGELFSCQNLDLSLSYDRTCKKMKSLNR